MARNGDSAPAEKPNRKRNFTRLRRHAEARRGVAMRLVICESSAEVADLVSSYVVKRINEFKPTATRPFVLGLPTGSSPELAYGRLVEMHRAQKVSFEHVGHVQHGRVL